MGLKDWISLALSGGALLVAIGSLVFAGAGIVASYFIAKHFGDVAAQEESQRLHEAEMSKARRAALRSLLTEVERARIVGGNNTKIPLNIGAATRLPVDAFSTAFSAGTPGVSVGEDLLARVAEYLALADEINCLVDHFGVVYSQDGFDLEVATLGQISVRCRESLPNILANLEACLRQELGLPAVEQQMSGSATPADEQS